MERLTTAFTVNSRQLCVDHKGVKILRFSFEKLLNIANGKERSLIRSNFSVFWRKGNFILPFAVCLKRHALSL